MFRICAAVILVPYLLIFAIYFYRCAFASGCYMYVSVFKARGSRTTVRKCKKQSKDLCEYCSDLYYRMQWTVVMHQYQYQTREVKQ